MGERELSTKEARPVHPLRIFVSYRRDDTGGHAGRLYDALASRYGRENVFMDIDTIDLGTDFTEAINRAVSSYDVVIALIGRGWLDARDAEGRRRLDNPEDFLRLELEAALARDVFVIPTCVEGAEIPPADRLPASLIALPVRQGIELRDVAWHDDVKRLIRRIDRLTGEQPEPRAVARRSRRPWAIAAVVLAVLAALAVVGALALDGSDGTEAVGDADERLLAAIPPVVRARCDPISFGEESALASVECGAVRTTAYYHLFESNEVMNTAYAQRREEVGIAPGSGECTAESFRGEEPYEAGRLLCFLDEGAPELVVTDERVSVGLEALVYEGTGEEAAKSLLRQWRCCLRTQPP